MSTIVCAISGHAPEEPVFSPKTGHVYEKRLIDQLIQGGGVCPVSKELLTLDDIVDMKANKAVRPRPASAASIPGMLGLMQGEWDSLITETYELKSHLDTTRKQLSHALYQHDAACRVIARLLRERDAARNQVGQLQDQLAAMKPMAAGETAEEVDESETGLTPEIIARMTDIAKNLSRSRKKRENPGLASVEEIKTMVCTGDFKVHQSTAPGILCLDVHKEDDNRIVTGGVDQQVMIFDVAQKKTVQKLVGHSKKEQDSGYGCMKFHPDGLILAGGCENNTVQVWDIKDQVTVATLSGHEGEVTALSFSENGYYLATASMDGTVKLWDLRKPLNIQTLKVSDGPVNYVRFDASGQYLSVGGSTAQIYNFESKANVAMTTEFKDHEASVMGVCLGNTSKTFASVSMDQTLRLYKVK